MYATLFILALDSSVLVVCNILLILLYFVFIFKCAVFLIIYLRKWFQTYFAPWNTFLSYRTIQRFITLIFSHWINWIIEIPYKAEMALEMCATKLNKRVLSTICDHISHNIGTVYEIDIRVLNCYVYDVYYVLCMANGEWQPTNGTNRKCLRDLTNIRFNRYLTEINCSAF